MWNYRNKMVTSCINQHTQNGTNGNKADNYISSLCSSKTELIMITKKVNSTKWWQQHMKICNTVNMSFL